MQMSIAFFYQSHSFKLIWYYLNRQQANICHKATLLCSSSLVISDKPEAAKVSLLPLQFYTPSALKQEVLSLARQILTVISDYFQAQRATWDNCQLCTEQEGVCVFGCVSKRAGSGRGHLSHLIQLEFVTLDHMLESVAAGQGRAKTFPQSKSDSVEQPETVWLKQHENRSIHQSLLCCFVWNQVLRVAASAEMPRLSWPRPPSAHPLGPQGTASPTCFGSPSGSPPSWPWIKETLTVSAFPVKVNSSWRTP